MSRGLEGCSDGGLALMALTAWCLHVGVASFVFLYGRQESGASIVVYSSFLRLLIVPLDAGACHVSCDVSSTWEELTADAHVLCRTEGVN